MSHFNVKKMVVSLLVLLLVIGPAMSTFAESYKSSNGMEQSDVNEKIMRFLEGEYGVEQAASLFQTINSLGLIDTNGKFVNHLINLDGTSYTLDKLKQLLADEHIDLTRVAEVDGKQISLDMLKKIIDVEADLEALRQTMYNDDAAITPEHLDSLDSLITQIGNEGMELNDDSASLFSISNSSPLTVSEDYEDETYVTVTNYENKWEWKIPGNQGSGRIYSVELTFQLNKMQKKEVSFSYELIEGSLGSLSSQWPLIDTITFQAGEIEKRVRVRAGELPPQTPPNYYGSDADTYRKNVWAKYARTDYIHFYNFRNVDAIYFNLGMDDTSSRVSTPSVFTHAYNGGAYLAYAPIKGTGDTYPQNDDIVGIFKYAYLNGIEHKIPVADRSSADNLKILGVDAKGGNYTTGQIVPYSVTFNKLVVHQMPVDVPANQHRLVLANGDSAGPAIVSPSTDELYNLKREISAHGYGELSFIQGYQAIVKKGMTADELRVVKSIGEGDPLYYYYTLGLYDFYQKPEFSNWWVFPDAVYPDANWNQPFTNAPNITISYAKSDAFQTLTLDKSSYEVGQTAKVTVKLENGDGEAGWIIDGGTSSEVISKRVKVSIGNKEQGLVELDWKRGEDGLPVSPPVLEGSFEITEALVDYMSSSNQASGKLRAKIYYNRNLNSGGEAIEDFGLLSDTFANFTVNSVKYIYPADLSITYPAVWPSGENNQVFVTSPVATKLGYTFPSDATYRTADQFEWRSSDATIAAITADGIIVPKQDGSVVFTLIAKNNGKLTPQTEITSVTIEIKSGGPAAVVVPDFANKVYVEKQKAAHIIWSTNVMSKYKELAAPGTTPDDANFSVTLYRGNWDETQLAARTPIQSWSAPATSELINATGFTIPSEYMMDISSQHTPSYTVRISTANPSNPARTLTALSYIVVKSSAAIITLDKSLGQLLTDDIGTVDLKWRLSSFDPENKGDFEFKVTKNGAFVPGSLITFNKETETFSHPGVSETEGTYALKIDPVSNNGKIKDVYAITLAAKNSLDSTWSYDSLYLQVYNHNALQIQIDGQSQTTHTMSNIAKIKNLTNDERIALERNITLKNELSMNYKQFSDLGEIADQISWKSSENAFGAINFNSYGQFANINKLQYSSYQPKQSFMLSGIDSGQTIITATHAKTGMNAKLDVTVQTLKDKLYLFQFYPKSLTTVTYKNGDGMDKSFVSNADGELALFDESGIASDVYVTSLFNDSTYTGVVSHATLLSKEKDAATMELYPINILQLRQLSKVEIFFKKPDGNPYTGKVTYRGGVYKNEHYCEPTEIGGTGITKQLGADGKLEIMFNTTDFYSQQAGETNAATLSANDLLDIVLEFTFDEDSYFPQLTILDGNSNAVDMIVFAEKIARLIDNPSQQHTPFIANQYIMDDNEDNKSSILNYTGKFGPNDQFPSITLTTELMWWGEQVGDDAYVELYDEVGYKPQGQSYQTIKYPFSNTVVTRHKQVLNKDTIWLEKAESGSIQYKLYDQSNGFRKSFISEASLINMIGVEEINAAELSDTLKKIKADMEAIDGTVQSPSSKDKIMGNALSFLSNLNIDVGPLVMKIIPTDNPLVFKTIISASFGNLPSISDGNTSGGSSDIEFLKDKNTTLLPGVKDIYQMAKETYMSEQRKKINNVEKGKANGRVLYAAGGYYLGEIKYNPQTGKWESIVQGGGFNVGGGYEFTRSYNKMLGPVPVTFSISIGGGIEVDFKASVLYDPLSDYPWRNEELTSVNDYLTSLRIIAYVELFGGLGFDYSVIAAKIGVFGRVSIENTSTWLNRDYLDNSSDHVQYGNKLSLEGIVGIRAVVKFLFLSKTYDFASLRYSYTWVFENWDKIQDYWSKYGASPLTTANVDVAITAYMNFIGEEDDHVFESNTLESRDYLAEYERSWLAPAGIKARSLDPVNEVPAELQTNAYPYSNPRLAQDGSLFVYLSDGNSTNIENTVASWAIRSGNSYVDQGKITTDAAFEGFGDTGLQVAGEDDLIAAVWVTQKEKIEKEAGEQVTDEEILLMNNSAEIIASIYDGKNWTTQRLTANTSPDLAPVVSIGDGKVVVTYRSVYSSNADNPLDFSESDSIVYTVYDTSTKQWSDVETLYNGTNGTVMGLSSETISDGTTAVVYSVNKGNVNQTPDADYIAAKDNEIIYTVINTDQDPAVPAATWRTKGVIKNLQVTNDTNANENPQLTSAQFTDGVERFIVAWHTSGEETGILEQDIKLLAINKDGEIYTEFVDSLNALQANNDMKINANFTFVQMPNAFKKIEHLSMLWKEAESDISATEVVTRDTLKAVKFGMDHNELYLSGVIDVAAMPDFTAIDNVDAYVSNSSGTEIKALILGTTYTTDTQMVGTITPRAEGEDGDEIRIHVSQTVSGMYTATETYTNTFNADEIILTPSEIVIGYDLPIQFNLVNQGISKIDSVTIDVGGQTTEFNDLLLFPNNSKVLTVPYNVPSQITAASYDVDVTFLDGEILSTNGILQLDIPDLGMSQIEVVEEEGGKRMLSVPIYNKNETTMDHKGRVVKLGLYRDTIYTEDNLLSDVIAISNDDDLKLIDNGGYIKNIEFDMKDYLTRLNFTEIPDKGIAIYLHSWVEEANGDVVTEFDESNNEAKVSFDNLAVKYNNSAILLTLEQTNSASATSVDLTMQNMNMAAVASGNVLLNLLDRNGQIIESKYLAASGSQLLSFVAEERKTRTVQFTQRGDNVQGMFFEEHADALDSTLSSLSLSGVKVGFDRNNTVYNLHTNDLKNTHVFAAASNSKSTVSLVDKAGQIISSNKGYVSIEQSLLLSTDGSLNELTIRVQPESQSGITTDYQFSITNKKSSSPNLELVVKGAKKEGLYVSDVELSLSSFDVGGFEIEKALYKVNNGNWVEVAYDGKAAQILTTLSGAGSYTIEAKVQLTSGQEYNLDHVMLEIVGVDAVNSSVTASSTQVTANGTDHSTITVTLKDTGGQLFSGRKIKLTADGGSSVIAAVEDTTNAAGEASFTVTNTQVETVTFNAKDEASGMTLAPVQVSFVAVDVVPTPSTTPSTPTPKPISEPIVGSTKIFRNNLIHFDQLLGTFIEKLKLPEPNHFTDSERHWAKDSINKLVKLGVINGYLDNSFKPNQSITRAEFASILVRLFHLSDSGETLIEFNDVQQHWAKNAIETLARHGIVKGYTDGTFKPNATITREEIVVMILRLVHVEELPQLGNIDFSDLLNAAEYAKDDIAVAVKAGIINGYGDHTFKPKGNATRAETTAILLKLLKLDPKLKEILEQ